MVVPAAHWLTILLLPWVRSVQQVVYQLLAIGTLPLVHLLNPLLVIIVTPVPLSKTLVGYIIVQVVQLLDSHKPHGKILLLRGPPGGAPTASTSM